MNAKVQIVTPHQLPEPCHAATVFDEIDPATLNPIQKVAVDALRAELDRLQSAILNVSAVIVSMHEVERETAFPYRVTREIDVASMMLQVQQLRDEFDARFRRVLHPWLDRSHKAEDIARQVRIDLNS